MRKKVRRKILIIFILITILGFFIPQNMIIPVDDASKNDWHPETFWYYPWGKSVTHKGVDIFAKEGTNIVIDLVRILPTVSNNLMSNTLK